MEKKYGRRITDKDIEHFKSCPNYFKGLINNANQDALIDDVRGIHNRLDHFEDKFEEQRKEVKTNRTYDKFILVIGILSLLFTLYKYTLGVR